jgi:hypothetical protein
MMPLRDHGLETMVVGGVYAGRAAGPIGEAASQATCQGCLDRPDRACVACGAPATIWTDAGDGRHAVAWCGPCHELLLSGRPSSAQPLIYLEVAAPVGAA